MKTIKVILVAILLGLMASCQFELPHDEEPTCEEMALKINEKYDKQLSDLYNLCPDKCDYSVEIKVIQKERRAALNELNCK